jgi:phosphatidylglycerophosphatase A
MRLINQIGVFLATGFGLGRSPIASGTVGTLPGLLIVAAVWPMGLAWQLAAALVLPLLAVPLCDIAERHFGKKDDGRIVADEYLTFPIAMVGLPLAPWVVAMAFVSSRFFDIVKPPPARALQRLHGGVGIVIDDVLASLYSLAFNQAVYWSVTRLLLT